MKPRESNRGRYFTLIMGEASFCLLPGSCSGTRSVGNLGQKPMDSGHNINISLKIFSNNCSEENRGALLPLRNKIN